MFRPRTIVAALLCAAAAILSSFAGAQPADDLPGLLVSRQLMEGQRLSVGAVVSLSADPTASSPRSFRIVGAFEPVPDPMRLGAVRHEVRLHLPDLLDMTANPANPLDAESVDAVNVAVAEGDAPRAVGRRLASAVPGVVARPAADDGQRAAPFVVLDRFHLAIAIVTVIASSIFLLALMLMLVEERRATVGILRLIGFRQRRILQHVLAEGTVIALAGALFGVLLSILMQDGINRFFQWRYDTALVFVRITPGVVLRSIVVAVPLGIAAILASSWSLLRSEVFSLTRR
jgi:putative ABC transport system permease protein